MAELLIQWKNLKKIFMEQFAVRKLRGIRRDSTMKIENKFARLMRNTGPARFLVPLGIILIVFGVIMSGMNTGREKGTLSGRCSERSKRTAI